ncbi:sulfotransferase domain-containing protein [Roseomonas terrae]|uniref:Sulfotransferase domain-containing protein n=1 Tax=Neoroseomonas terrae TaxID=424799 RepID=A0ABS5EKM4_9PROT|nr:sulfotransferase domain-containing protein [Neoroseomonas terrae]
MTEDLPNPAPEASGERPKMVVGTFHKTGTWLMIGIFSRICKELGYRMWMRGTEKTRDEWDLFLDPLSRFDPCHLEGNFRGTVVIRDPRDVIISGAFYHSRLKKGQNDAWVHLPSPAYDGMTYQEKLNSLPSDEARFAFEMDNMGGRTIERMQRFVSLRPEFRLTRFEDLVTDEELFEFHRVFAWLGIRGEHLGPALAIAYAQSLFSGRRRTSHIRSGQPQQWREHFTPALHARFREKFGDVAERLGYPAA